MHAPTLVIGNKNYSSWSLRPWFLLRQAGIPFQEVRIALDQPDTRARILAYSPAGRVPVLIAGKQHVWDSLAICEFLAERFRECAWPADAEARAHARSIAAEMHSGFSALRSELPMNCRARRRLVPSPAAQADIARILEIWRGCRERYHAAGPWLYGTFSPADAMYAPVALRFVTYAVETPGRAADYVNAVTQDPDIRAWVAAASAETEVIGADEAGTPV